MFRKVIHLIPCLALFVLLLSSPAHADLVGWWKFDEASGTVAADSSANGNDGNLVNGGTWIAGQNDGALQLNGTGLTRPKR